MFTNSADYYSYPADIFWINKTFYIKHTVNMHLLLRENKNYSPLSLCGYNDLIIYHEIH